MYFAVKEKEESPIVYPGKMVSEWKGFFPVFHEFLAAF